MFDLELKTLTSLGSPNDLELRDTATSTGPSGQIFPQSAFKEGFEKKDLATSEPQETGGQPFRRIHVSTAPDTGINGFFRLPDSTFI